MCVSGSQCFFFFFLYVPPFFFFLFLCTLTSKQKITKRSLCETTRRMPGARKDVQFLLLYTNVVGDSFSLFSLVIAVFFASRQTHTNTFFWFLSFSYSYSAIFFFAFDHHRRTSLGITPENRPVEFKHKYRRNRVRQFRHFLKFLFVVLTIVSPSVPKQKKKRSSTKTLR